MATVAADFGRVPTSPTLTLKPFEANVSDEKLRQLKTLLELSPLGPATWENTSNEQGETALSNSRRRHGVRRDWLSDAKDQWLNGFDWRQTEKRINSFPNFTAEITDSDGVPFTIHFIALFSAKPDAIPLAFYHGWPGSILEFLPILNILRDRYTPETLPYHIIVPSLPGYAFSSAPPVDSNYNTIKAATLLHQLILGLGFTNYLAQGGDIGSSIASYQGGLFPECKSVHLNFLSAPAWVDREKNKETMNDVEAASLVRGQEFLSKGNAYSREHGTRTATIGLVLSSSPLALLAWIGEKFLEWSDTDIPLDDILASVTLYWLTETQPRGIYFYRTNEDPNRVPLPVIEKTIGFSFFPKELLPSPRHLVEQMAKEVIYYSHDKGGHFAALERPEVLLRDVEDWVSKVWVKAG